MCDALLSRVVTQQLPAGMAASRPVQLLTRGETEESMLLGAESCAPDVGLTRDKAQHCFGAMEEINSAALAAEPPQHT